jgi:hypothetical protein
LLGAAAERAQQRNRRLLLVVDGLDEDQGARPGSGRPSVASLLPSRPYPALRVLVMSRLHPDLPRDVPHAHPLRRAVPRILEPYGGARDLAELATQEVLGAINGDRLDADVFVFLTASGDGLSVDELAELTGQLGSQIESRVESAFGRSLRAAPPSGLLSPDDVYFFAHDTLLDVARAEIRDADIRRYRELIHAWADRYRDRAWPETTPGYLLRGYAKLLADTSDLARLETLTTDAARQRRLFAASGGDAAALGELERAEDAALSATNAQLPMIAALAAARHVIHVRNRNVPIDLPVAWARAGQPVRAEATARSLRDDDRPKALVRLIGALSELGDYERARSLVAELPKARQPEALVAIATSRADDAPDEARQLLDRAEKAATELEDRERKTAVAEVAHGYVTAGDLARAESAARSLADSGRAPAAVPVAAALVRAGDPDAARELACSVHYAFDREDVIAAVVGATAEMGDVDGAEAIARTGFGGDFYDEGPAIVTLARVVTRAGDPDRAERLARSLAEGWRQNDALAAVASECALMGDVAHAQELAGALSDTGWPGSADHDRAEISVAVVATHARDGQWERADAVARDVPDWALDGVAEAVARAGNGALAERIANRAAAEWRTRALASAAVALLEGPSTEARRSVAVQLAESTEALSRGIFDVVAARAVAAVARTAARIGDVETATDLVDMLTGDDQQEARIAVAEAAAAAGRPDAAVDLAERLADPPVKLRVLSAAIAAGPGRELLKRADKLAATLSHGGYSWKSALQAFVAALVRAGELDEAETRAQTLDADGASDLISAVSAEEGRMGYADRAEALARTLTTDDDVRWALSAVAAGLADAGQADRAQAVIRTISPSGGGFPRPRGDFEHPPPPPNPERLNALLPTARAFARRGDFDGAQEVAARLPREVRAQSLVELARIALVLDPARAADLVQSAQETLSSIPYHFEHIATAAVEVRSLAADSDFDDLLAHTREAQNRELHQEIANVIDEALRAGNDALARRYLTVLLTTDGWLLGLDALARLDPEAVRRVTRLLHG